MQNNMLHMLDKKCHVISYLKKWMTKSNTTKRMRKTRCTLLPQEEKGKGRSVFSLFPRQRVNNSCMAAAIIFIQFCNFPLSIHINSERLCSSRTLQSAQGHSFQIKVWGNWKFERTVNNMLFAEKEGLVHFNINKCKNLNIRIGHTFF